MNSRSFRYNEKETAGESQNPKKTLVSKSPLEEQKYKLVKPIRMSIYGCLQPESTSNDFSPNENSEIGNVGKHLERGLKNKERELLSTECGAYCLDSSMVIEPTSNNLQPKEQKYKIYKQVKPIRKSIMGSLQLESTSNKLLPNENSEIENVGKHLERGLPNTERELLITESGALCLDSSMDLEPTSKNLPPNEQKYKPVKPIRNSIKANLQLESISNELLPNENSEIETVGKHLERVLRHTKRELLSTESDAYCLDSSMDRESTSKNLPPKETSGIEDVQEPNDIRCVASCLDLPMVNGDLNINRDIGKGLESNEDSHVGETPIEVHYDSSICSSSDDENFEEADPEGRIRQIITSYDEHLPWMKLELSKVIVQNVARFLGEELETSGKLNKDMKKHLITAKNMIEEQLEINVGGLASNGEAGDDVERPVEDLRFDKGNSSKLLKDMLGNFMNLSDIVVGYEESLDEMPGKGPGKHKLLQEMVYTSLELCDIVRDYEESIDLRSDNKSVTEELINQIIDEGLLLMDCVLEYEKTLNPKLGCTEWAKYWFQKITATNKALSDLVLDYLETSDLSYLGWRGGFRRPLKPLDWDEHDRQNQNAGSYPKFVANFLLMAVLFAVVVFPALFVKYAPSEWWPKCISMLFNISQSIIT